MLLSISVFKDGKFSFLGLAAKEIESDCPFTQQSICIIFETPTGR